MTFEKSQPKPVRCGCGGEAIVDYLIGEPSEGNSYCVYCKVCEMHTSYYDTEAEAIMAWNKAMSGHTRWSNLADVRPEGVYCKVCGYRMDCDE